MKITKARVAIVVLSALLVASLAMELWHYRERKEWIAEREMFEEVTTGELVWRDGLWQDSLIYLTDFAINEETDRVTFTMRILHSSQTKMGADPYQIQTRQDGEWVYIPSYQAYLYEQGGEIAVPEYAIGIGPFADQRGGCSFPAEDRVPGEYRVIKKIGTYTFPGGSAGIYAVGYFTIP